MTNLPRPSKRWLVKVVGVKNEHGGDVVVGFVTPCADDAVTEQELIAFCQAKLAPFKVPARVALRHEFPVTVGTNGTKIRTAELRERATELIAARR